MLALNDRRLDELDLKARVDEIANRHPAVGLAVGVVRNGRLECFRGHGLADIASNAPVTEDTVFRIASITNMLSPVEAISSPSASISAQQATTSSDSQSLRMRWPTVLPGAS
jgi:hypothetical protein